MNTVADNKPCSALMMRQALALEEPPRFGGALQQDIDVDACIIGGGHGTVGGDLSEA